MTKEGIKIKKIKGGEISVVFELIKLQREGRLKSKLITFKGGHAVRVYWDAEHEGEPLYD